MPWTGRLLTKVASEIQQLATQSNESANEVESIVTTIADNATQVNGIADQLCDAIDKFKF